LGAQQGAVDRATERRDEAQGRLVETQGNRAGIESGIAQATQSAQVSDASQAANSDAMPEVRISVEQMRNQLEFWMQRESQAQNEVNEAEEQLRVEQGKLAELQEELDRIDRELAEAHAD
jgi:chromosome segregation ATPase